MSNTHDVAPSVKDNVAIVLVPGSFSPTEFYNQVYRQLVVDGYNNVTPCPLLSASAKNAQRRPPPKLGDDTLYIREVLQAHLTRGRDVILVMNSYGGFPGTEALKGLPSRSYIEESTEDPKQVRQGAMVGLLYLSSFLPFEGDSIRSMMGEVLPEPMRSGTPGEYMELEAGGGPWVFADLAAEGKLDAAERHFEAMVTHSSDSFDGAFSHTLWQPGSFQGSVIYLSGGLDNVVPAELTRSMIKRVADVAGEDKVKLVTVEDGGHVMHVSKPDVVVDLLKTLVSDVSKQP